MWKKIFERAYLKLSQTELPPMRITSGYETQRVESPGFYSRKTETKLKTKKLNR
jgi:hypothetical protein